MSLQRRVVAFKTYFKSREVAKLAKKEKAFIIEQGRASYSDHIHYSMYE